MVLLPTSTEFFELVFINEKIQEIVIKLSQSDEVKSLITSEKVVNQTDSFLWNSQSLYNGYPSLLLFFSELQSSFPQQDYEREILSYFIAIKETFNSMGIPSLSLFSGLSGICFATNKAAKQVKKLTKAKNKLDQLLFQKLENDLLPIIDEYLVTKSFLPQKYYDLIYGIIGIGVYLSEIINEGNKAEALLKRIIKQCIEISTLNKFGSSNYFLFFNPPYNMNSEERSFFKRGNYNLGMSHGASGILAFLTKMLIAGVIVPGQKETIEELMFWLLNQSFSFKGCLCWGVRSLDKILQEEMKPPMNNLFRLGWCDGISGILRSIYLASKALNNKEVKSSTEKYLVENISTFIDEKLIHSPTLCHGYTGLNLILSLMANETSLQKIRDLELISYKKICALYNRSNSFGFSDIANLAKNNYDFRADDSLEQIIQKLTSAKKVEVSQPGLLNGAVGILLAILSRHTNNYSWTKLFLI